MKRRFPDGKRLFLISVLFLALSPAVRTIFAQQVPDTVNGRVVDGTGGAIVGATVRVTDAEGNTKTVTTNATGSYAFSDLPPGRYTVSAFFAGFAPYENPAVDIAAGRTTFLPILLSLAPVKQELTIELPVQYGGVFNAGAIVLPGDDFEALPDDLRAEIAPEL